VIIKFTPFLAMLALLVTILSLSISIFNFYKNDDEIKFSYKKPILEFDSKLTEINKLELLTKKIDSINIDTNYHYFINHVKGLKYGQLPTYYDLYDKDLNYLQSLGSRTKDINQLMQTLESRNPKISKALFKLDNFNKEKKKKINISGIGDVSFCLEDSMKLDETYRALLIISKEVKIEFINSLMIKAFPEGTPKKIVDTMTLSKRIFASILPAVADQFTIIRADLDTVKTIDIEGRDFITWEWFVTPKKAGESSLVLKLSRVEAQAGELDKFFPTKLIKVHVSAEEKSISEILSDFWSDEWKWILTSIAALISWIFLYKQNREKKALESTKNVLLAKGKLKSRKKK
jgi:hypothetical protein